jgi:hypothetical protein
MIDLKKFDKAQAEVSKHVEACNQIVINSDESLQSARELLKKTVETKTYIELKRQELGKPHLDAQREINDYAKSLVLPLDAAVANGKKKILEYEQEKERKRLEEKARLEAIRKEKEAAERAERERVEFLKAKMRDFDDQAIRAMHKCQTVKDIEDYIKALNMYAVTEKQFQEFVNDAQELKKALIERAEMHRDFLKKQELQKAEAERLQGIAKEQAELKAAQELEAQKIREEIEAIEREKIRMEKEKANREASELAEIKRIKEAKADQDRIKELEAQKSKNIRKDWTFDLINISQVPREYLTLDESKVKQAIRNGTKEIPGLKVYQKEIAILR